MTTPPDGFRAETVVAVEAVERALGLVPGSVSTGEISFKGPRDLVTGTDIAVEDSMRDTLAGIGFPVIGEERGGEAPVDGSPYWLLDPICGTRNLASGIPLFSVNLALVENGTVSVGVVGIPSTGEIDVAELGRGAWAVENGARRPLAASDQSETIVVEEGRSEGVRREHAALFTAAAIRANRWDLRVLSSTLSLSYVAAGRVAAYVLFRGSALHGGAGCLLAAEAGATVSDLEGRPWTIDSDSIVASANAGLHRDLLDLGRDTRPASDGENG